MTDDAGEVVVRQNHHEHAVDAPDLDRPIRVDLDGAVPKVHVPSEVGVMYHDDEEDDLETDGGATVDRTDVAMRGAGISEEMALWGIVLAALLLASSGYLLGDELVLSDVAALGGGGLLGWITTAAYWRADG